jgi:predicted PurR-regulated permease PerM
MTQRATSDLLVGAGLSAVLPLGDIQYNSASLANILAVYDPTWGRFKAITWAVILAILVYPVYAWLLKLLRWQATPAALIVIVVITLLVIIPGIELGWFLTDEAIELVQAVRSLMSRASVDS